MNRSTLIIIDWDDTLFPTTWVHDNNISLLNNVNKNKNKFYELDNTIFDVLTNLSKLGKVVIVTNAAKKWVSMSSVVLPQTKQLINESINVISARDMYKKEYPKDTYIWKKLVFKNLVLTHFMYRFSTENIVSIGDADYEYKALVDLYNNNLKTPKRILKSVKLIRYPSVDVLLDQLKVLNDSVSDICSHNTHIDLVFGNK